MDVTAEKEITVFRTLLDIHHNEARHEKARELVLFPDSAAVAGRLLLSL